MRPSIGEPGSHPGLQLREGHPLLPALCYTDSKQVFEMTPRLYLGLPGLATDTLTLSVAYLHARIMRTREQTRDAPAPRQHVPDEGGPRDQPASLCRLGQLDPLRTAVRFLRMPWQCSQGSGSRRTTRDPSLPGWTTRARLSLPPRISYKSTFAFRLLTDVFAQVCMP
jgi:hypothetical protein